MAVRVDSLCPGRPVGACINTSRTADQTSRHTTIDCTGDPSAGQRRQNRAPTSLGPASPSRTYELGFDPLLPVLPTHLAAVVARTTGGSVAAPAAACCDVGRHWCETLSSSALARLENDVLWVSLLPGSVKEAFTGTSVSTRWTSQSAVYKRRTL